MSQCSPCKPQINPESKLNIFFFSFCWGVCVCVYIIFLRGWKIQYPYNQHYDRIFSTFHDLHPTDGDMSLLLWSWSHVNRTSSLPFFKCIPSAHANKFPTVWKQLLDFSKKSEAGEQHSDGVCRLPRASPLGSLHRVHTNRKIKWLGLEGPLHITQLHPSCHGQRCHPLDQAAHKGVLNAPPWGKSALWMGKACFSFSLTRKRWLHNSRNGLKCCYLVIPPESSIFRVPIPHGLSILTRCEAPNFSLAIWGCTEGVLFFSPFKWGFCVTVDSNFRASQLWLC